MVGVGKGAQSGVLIKNAEALENMNKVDVLITDKTGTLTEGKPSVEKIYSVANNEDALLQMIASLNHYSEHPLAQAVVKYANQKAIALTEVNDFEALTGKGVTGTVNTTKVALGNKILMEDIKVSVSDDLERKIIEILLLYGNKMEEFEDVLLKTNAEGEIEQVVEKKEYKVYQRIYLSLQEDEVELANPLFRAIFNDLINYYLQNEDFGIENYLKHLPDQFAQEVTDILMEDERLTLHKWDDQNIFVKQKSETVSQHTSEIIISMREYLINKLILDLMSEFVEKPDSDQEELKVLINDYNKLKVNLTGTIGRIRSTYI
jgi:hypothetical protein